MFCPPFGSREPSDGRALSPARRRDRKPGWSSADCVRNAAKHAAERSEADRLKRWLRGEVLHDLACGERDHQPRQAGHNHADADQDPERP